MTPLWTVGGAVSSGALAHLHIEQLWQLGSHAGVIAVISSALYFGLLRRQSDQA